MQRGRGMGLALGLPEFGHLGRVEEEGGLD